MNFVIQTRQDNAVVKQCLLSVFELGCKSPHVSDLLGICRNIAFRYFMYSPNRKELLDKSGLSAEDIATNCVELLFETRNGKFTKIENHFRKVLPRICSSKLVGQTFLSVMRNSHEDILISILVPLIRSRTKQELSNLCKENGKLHPKIQKAVNVYLKRWRTKDERYLDDVYLFTCDCGELDFSRPVIEPEVLLDILYEKKLINPPIPKLVRGVFAHLNSQDEYLKAITYTELLDVIIEYFKRRMKDRGYDVW